MFGSAQKQLGLIARDDHMFMDFLSKRAVFCDGVG